MGNSKKRLLVIAAGVVAVVLVCVLLVGLLDGVWPWSSSIGGGYTGMPTSDNDSTAEETEGAADGNTITGNPAGTGTGNGGTGNVDSGSNGAEETGVSVGVETGSDVEDIMTNPDNKLVIDFDDLPS